MFENTTQLIFYIIFRTFFLQRSKTWNLFSGACDTKFAGADIYYAKRFMMIIGLLCYLKLFPGQRQKLKCCCYYG